MTVEKIPVHRFTAINSLQPNARFLGASDQVTLWKTPDIPQPTEEEIQAEITRLTDEYHAVKYQRDRQPQYPSLADFADAMYWNSKGDDTHLKAYYAACEKVKSDNPKP
tara:strand:+ start:1237 stop:1563 length:327 start_codon:yes stop_codon:yes gene_type:complete